MSLQLTKTKSLNTLGLKTWNFLRRNVESENSCTEFKGYIGTWLGPKDKQIFKVQSSHLPATFNLALFYPSFDICFILYFFLYKYIHSYKNSLQRP